MELLATKKNIVNGYIPPVVLAKCCAALFLPVLKFRYTHVQTKMMSGIVIDINVTEKCCDSDILTILSLVWLKVSSFR